MKALRDRADGLPFVIPLTEMLLLKETPLGVPAVALSFRKHSDEKTNFCPQAHAFAKHRSVRSAIVNGSGCLSDICLSYC